MRWAGRRLRIAGLVALTVIGGWAAALGMQASLPRAGKMSASSMPAASPGWLITGEGKLQMADELTDIAWDLEYDATRDRVWYVTGSGAEATLNWSDQGGERNAFPLPDGTWAGIHHKVRVTPSGQVVANHDYGLISYNPESGKVANVVLDPKSNQAFDNAFDPGNPLPGTWVSSFGVAADGRLYVARNNIPQLTVLTSDSLVARNPVSIPARYAGAWRVIVEPGGFDLLSRDGAIGRFDSSGSLLDEWDIGAVDLIEIDQTLVAAEGHGTIMVIDQRSGGQTQMADSPGSLIFGTSAKGLVSYNGLDGVIFVRRLNGDVLLETALVTQAITSGGTDSPMIPPTITDVVQSRDGTLWISRGDSRTLWTFTR